ncbi:hypothetical protein BRD56_12625 [Thermoplasmatales archaeon SW_10_69_26]|nr:MAG: hypothetical protein BRD56_12625 [Thermoplasmatales archaeon SW_10_69_26]
MADEQGTSGNGASRPDPQRGEEGQASPSRWARRCEEANEETLAAAIEQQAKLRRRTHAQADELVERARTSMRWIRSLSLATFVVGIVLLGTALSLAVSGGEASSVLGLGATGTASMLGVLFYRPMERMQEATSDLAQQETLLRTWAIGVDLELMAADTFEPATVRQAAGRLQRSAVRLSRSLEAHVEDDVSRDGMGPDTDNESQATDDGNA